MLFATHMKHCPLWPSDQSLKPPTLHLKTWKIFRSKSCKGSRGNPAQPSSCSVRLVRPGMNQLSLRTRLCHGFHSPLQGQRTVKGFTLLQRRSRSKLAFVSISLHLSCCALKRRPCPHPGGRHLAGQGSTRPTAKLKALHKKIHV